jgi:hypothetical protein
MNLDDKSLASIPLSRFPYFGGKSAVAQLVWERLGDVDNFIEPFCGSAAMLLGRLTPPKIETINDADCVARGTRILTADLRWIKACEVCVGSKLAAFDEFNGEAREGFRAPEKYRRWQVATVTDVRIIKKPCYRLTFDDGTTVICSACHQWLGGSHVTGGRGWRWQKTESLVCNRATQRSWVCKLVDVVEPEMNYEAGWLAGFFDGEGSIKPPSGWEANVAQKHRPELERADALLKKRGFSVRLVNAHRDNPEHSPLAHLCITGGMRETFKFLMQIRPERLIRNLVRSFPERSLYGRQKQAVGLVEKEFLGEQDVVAIETDCHTFVAEGLASHNCYVSNFWRATSRDPEAVAEYADFPVSECDLHARHKWLVL